MSSNKKLFVLLEFQESKAHHIIRCFPIILLRAENTTLVRLHIDKEKIFNLRDVLCRAHYDIVKTRG